MKHDGDYNRWQHDEATTTNWCLTNRQANVPILFIENLSRLSQSRHRSLSHPAARYVRVGAARYRPHLYPAPFHNYPCRRSSFQAPLSRLWGVFSVLAAKSNEGPLQRYEIVPHSVKSFTGAEIVPQGSRVKSYSPYQDGSRAL